MEQNWIHFSNSNVCLTSFYVYQDTAVLHFSRNEHLGVWTYSLTGNCPNESRAKVSKRGLWQRSIVNSGEGVRSRKEYARNFCGHGRNWHWVQCLTISLRSQIRFACRLCIRPKMKVQKRTSSLRLTSFLQALTWRDCQAKLMQGCIKRYTGCRRDRRFEGRERSSRGQDLLGGKLLEASKCWLQVRLWKTARTQEEILTNMRKANGLENHSELIAYWKFNDPDQWDSHPLYHLQTTSTLLVPSIRFICSWLYLEHSGYSFEKASNLWSVTRSRHVRSARVECLETVLIARQRAFV